jgi:hypothetical protein
VNGQLFDLSPGDTTITNNEWYTPRWIFDAAGLIFDLDVCAPIAPESRTCPARRYLTVLDDGLTTAWDGLVWMNPPYSTTAPWVDRFITHPDGLALVQAANSSWLERLQPAIDAIALLSLRHNRSGRQLRGFLRADGGTVEYPTLLILAGRGALAVDAVRRVAAADSYTGGAWFARPVEFPAQEPAGRGTVGG